MTTEPGGWGRTLYLKRIERGVSQEKLARHLDVTHNQVSRWERNISFPTDINRHRIAEFYGMDVDDLFPGVDAEEVVA